MAAEEGAGRPFVGRVEAVEALRRQFEDARAGFAGVTLLVGETGVGKSALVTHLVEEIRGRGVSVLLGRAPPLDDPPPFSLLRSAIESAHADSSPSAGSAPMAPVSPVLIGFAPRLGEETLPNLVSIEQRLLDALGGADERGEQARLRVLTELLEQFLEVTRHGPLVLVVEDLHRADESSLAAVEFLVAQLEHERFWLLATCRPYVSLSASGRARLERFETVSRARKVVLRPMTSGEVADYLHWSDPSRVYAPEEVARRYSESRGNPLLLQQLDHRASSGGVPAAEGVSLGPEEQRAIDVAAVLGPEFSFDTLLRVSGEEDEEHFTEIVDRLVGAGALLERMGEVLAFPGDQFREQVYSRLPERRRQLLHWSAGETLEATGRAGVATVYSLARHFYLGRSGAKSVKYNRLAAEIADRALAPEAARDHLLRAVESQRDVTPENIETESELVLDLVRVTEELGHLADAERTLRAFLDREQDDPRLSLRRRAGLEVFLSRVLTDQGKLPAASELAQKLLTTPGLESEPVLLVGAHHQLGMALYYAGEYAEALHHHTEELELARKVGNPLVTLRAQIWRVAALAMMGPTDEAVAEARALTIARDGLDSLRESAQAHLFLGDMLADARCTPAQRQEALAEYARAVEFAERAHDPRRVGWANYKTGELLREARRFDEATEALDTASAIFEEVGDQVGLSMTTKVRGQIAMDQGAHDLAERHLLEAHRLLKGLHHTLEELDVLLQLAELSLARGERARTEEYVREIERLRLSALRPDLAPEFERLQRSLGTEERDRAGR